MTKKEKLVAWLDSEIKQIEEDDRHTRKRANILVNAPVALIQTSLTARLAALKQVKERLTDETETADQ